MMSAAFGLKKIHIPLSIRCVKPVLEMVSMRVDWSAVAGIMVNAALGLM